MKKYLLLSVLGVFLLSSCDKTLEMPEGTNPPEIDNPTITKAVFSGYVQKGPFVNGYSVTITLLDENLKQTGKVFSTQIIDNSGKFELNDIEFASNFVELKAEGYYFNEVQGATSNGTLALYALADITDVNSVNINILTHLERPRIIDLVKNGLSFSAAKKQARSEVLDIFKFSLPDGVASESLNITEDALLLAVSAIIQGNLSTGDMSELLANISSDILKFGKLNNPTWGSQLANNVAILNPEQIISNMKNKYNGLGIPVNISGTELKGYFEQFMDNGGFEQTLPVVYSVSGKYGQNILADGFVDAKRYERNAPKTYSVRAELPPGRSSLKIVIKSESGLKWGEYNQGKSENWLVSNTDDSSITFTAVESGKYSDASVNLFPGDIIIEYYEYGTTEPTKVKKVNVVKGEIIEDDEHEREMLIAFYKSTNGDNWVRNDNWCSDKPMSEWYGVKTRYDRKLAYQGINHVEYLELPNNNLTGDAYIADLKSIYVLNILNGNKIESLTIDNCANEMFDDMNNYNIGFYHDYNYKLCNLKALNISNTNGYIYINGNFAAETVTISNCNLSKEECMYFNLPSTKVGTLTVSDCTMGYFYADNSVIGNINIDNCTFLTDEHGNRAYIYVGNKTTVNNCKGLKSIYSSRPCSELTVTNTVCNNVSCGN